MEKLDVANNYRIHQDYKKAEALYLTLLDINDIVGNVESGLAYTYLMLYEKENPNNKDKEAFGLSKIGCMRRNGLAYSNLGFCFEYGRGTTKDLSKAVEFYKHAVKLGNVNGMINLGLCYELGDGVDQDLFQAFKLYRLSAKQNHPYGQELLADCLLKEQNKIQALCFYELSAKQGNLDAEKKRMDLLYQMPLTKHDAFFSHLKQQQQLPKVLWIQIVSFLDPIQKMQNFLVSKFLYHVTKIAFGKKLKFHKITHSYFSSSTINFIQSNFKLWIKKDFFFVFNQKNIPQIQGEIVGYTSRYLSEEKQASEIVDLIKIGETRWGAPIDGTTLDVAFTDHYYLYILYKTSIDSVYWISLNNLQNPHSAPREIGFKNIDHDSDIKLAASEEWIVLGSLQEIKIYEHKFELEQFKFIFKKKFNSKLDEIKVKQTNHLAFVLHIFRFDILYLNGYLFVLVVMYNHLIRLFILDLNCSTKHLKLLTEFCFFTSCQRFALGAEFFYLESTEVNRLSDYYFYNFQGNLLSILKNPFTSFSPNCSIGLENTIISNLKQPNNKIDLLLYKYPEIIHYTLELAYNDREKIFLPPVKKRKWLTPCFLDL